MTKRKTIVVLIAAIVVLLVAGIVFIVAFVNDNDELTGNRLKFVMKENNMDIEKDSRMREVSIGIVFGACEHPAEQEIRTKPIYKPDKERC
ncbi:MAG: hypothetical protein IJA35_07425 [Clostridia bacterium]|nr:hypothetical protein [Clostridia bacterium]